MDIETWTVGLAWLCVAMAAGACLFFIHVRRMLRRFRWLGPGDGDGTPRGKVSVVVPARNEESDLEEALRSLLAQRNVDLEIVVVNDHSTDRTGEIAAALAREDPRLRVINDPPLRSGWLGKANAMQQAFDRLDAEYVLFTDADVIHAPESVAAGLAELRRRDLGLLSLFGSLEFHGLWENALVPGMIGWIGLHVRPQVEDPDSTCAVAAGAYLLVRSRHLRAIGGFETVKGEMLDDVELARRFKEHRIPVGLCPAPELLRVRMFKSAGDAFWGMTKNVLAAAGDRTWLFAPMLAVTVVSHWLPPACAVAGVLLPDGFLLTAALAAFASQYLGLFWFRRLAAFRPLLALPPLLPLPVICCTLRALYHLKVRRAVFWRGRSIRVR